MNDIITLERANQHRSHRNYIWRDNEAWFMAQIDGKMLKQMLDARINHTRIMGFVLVAVSFDYTVQH